jgi:MFS family permease
MVVEFYFGILKKKKYFKLLTLFLITFIYSFGWGLLTPIFSIKIQEIVKNIFLTGVIFSIFGLVRIIFDVPIGMICDRYNLKKIILFSLTIYIPLIISYALAENFQQLLLIRFVHAIAAVLFWTAIWTYLRRVIKKRYETEEISFFSFFSDIASTTGPILGGFIALFYPNLPFYLMSLICFLLLIIVHYKLPDLPIMQKHSIVSMIQKDIGEVKKIKDFFLRFSFIVVIFFLIWNFFNSFLPIILNNLGFNYAQIGFLISLTTLPIIFSEIRIGRFIDFKGKKYGIVFACLLYTISFLLFPFIRNIFLIFLVLAVMSFSNIFFYLSTNAIIVDISKNEERGLFTGLFEMIQDIGIAIGPILGGFLFSSTSYVNTFIFFSILSFIALIITLNLKFKK